MNDPHGITKENLLNAFPIALSSDPKLMALVDADGDLAAIKTFLSKGKDSDVKFTFEFDDEF